MQGYEASILDLRGAQGCSVETSDLMRSQSRGEGLRVDEGTVVEQRRQERSGRTT